MTIQSVRSKFDELRSSPSYPVVLKALLVTRDGYNKPVRLEIEHHGVLIGEDAPEPGSEFEMIAFFICIGAFILGWDTLGFLYGLLGSVVVGLLLATVWLLYSATGPKARAPLNLIARVPMENVTSLMTWAKETKKKSMHGLGLNTDQGQFRFLSLEALGESDFARAANAILTAHLDLTGELLRVLDARPGVLTPENIVHEISVQTPSDY